MSELAAEAGTNSGNMHGEVERLVDAGILADRRVGRTRLVRDAGSIYSPALTELMMLAYGPKALLEETLGAVPGVQQAFIFGSWAARYDGIPGALPKDVDVLIVGEDVDRDDIFSRAMVVGAKLHQEFQVVFRSPQAWAAAIDPFLVTVKSRPLVELNLVSA